MADRIDLKVYEPGSPMEGLSSLKFSEIEEIARFLVYGKHIQDWINGEYHGDAVGEIGSKKCMKCHDNDLIKKIEIPRCSKCH